MYMCSWVMRCSVGCEDALLRCHKLVEGTDDGSDVYS
jgi:hypothetical protein